MEQWYCTMDLVTCLIPQVGTDGGVYDEYWMLMKK